MSSFTTPVHERPYPAIDPYKPSLSQAGKTVIVAGASTGIGFAIARAFVKASATKVILLGRRPMVLAAAMEQLKNEVPSSKSEVSGRICDISDGASVVNLWSELEKENIYVDVLVLNAMRVPEAGPILEIGLDSLWEDYVSNVKAPLDMTKRFHSQKTGRGKKYLIYLSTLAIYDLDISGNRPNYTAVKATATLTMQLIAKDVAAKELQVMIFHPGRVATETTRGAGYPDHLLPDDENLPGQFAVWAATDEAEFVHGRFLWAKWDVEDLRRPDILERLEKDKYFLKIGVNGLVKDDDLAFNGPGT